LTCVITLLCLFGYHALMEQLTNAQTKDLKLLFNFVRIYCGAKHGDQIKTNIQVKNITVRETYLCRECAEVARHALAKRRNCLLEPKPSCKKCIVHCYGRDYRERIREIMAFSGRRMILRGRLDYLRHYFF
jgi:hypothetical protein